ncbi:hypothetical protein HOY80DRAFT_1038646 [Tuber brumale]|nr:hypothetical protein HOY80DRAFT_1038646 [Tuber brumale]
METTAAKSRAKKLHPSKDPELRATTTRNRLPRAPFSAYPKRLKLSDLSELSELSRLSRRSRRSRELDEPTEPEHKPSTANISGAGTTEAPFEISESPNLPPTPCPRPRYASADDGLDLDLSWTEMPELLGINTTGKKEKESGEDEEEYWEITTSPRDLSSSPTLAPTSTHRGELHQLPRSSEAPAPLTSILAPPTPATRRIIQGKGSPLESNTKDTYIYYHEIGAIISKDPVNEDDSSQEEIILLVEVRAGFVAKTNTANTIVICKSHTEANRLGRSFDNDKWIALVHPKVGKIWLFRIPHVRLLIGGRRPAAKCGICEGAIPEGKIAHGCVYTRETVGDGGDTEPVLSNVKKVRFALK